MDYTFQSSNPQKIVFGDPQNFEVGNKNVLQNAFISNSLHNQLKQKTKLLIIMATRMDQTVKK